MAQIWVTREHEFLKGAQLSKGRPFNLSSSILRLCETIWFKLGKHSRSSIKHHLTQSNEALNVNQNMVKEL